RTARRARRRDRMSPRSPDRRRSRRRRALPATASGHPSVPARPSVPAQRDASARPGGRRGGAVPERQTVGRELTRAWEARFPRTGPKPEWARRLEPGHVRMWILRVVAAFDHARLADLPTRTALPGRAPDGHLLPKMTAAVPPELRQALRRRLADPLTWEIVAA